MSYKMDRIIGEGLTFDDVLIVPRYSEVLPSQVDITTRLTRNITMNCPIVSAAMDTITDSRLAIALAREGGIGIIHKNMPIEQQALEVKRVKRCENGMIYDPVTIKRGSTVKDALDLMAEYHIGGIPVVDDENPNTNTYEMVPGTNITKDPLITVEADSEDSWLFVKLDKSGNFDTFMSYALAEGWTELTGETGVYYRETSWSDKAQEFYVLQNNTVTVKKDITKEQLNELDKNGAKNYPTLTVTAYAVQRNASLEEIDTAAEAWALANPAPVEETTEAAE